MNGLWVILPDGESFVVQEGPFVAFLDGSMTAEADPQVSETHANALSPSLSSGSASVERYSLRPLFLDVSKSALSCNSRVLQPT